MKHWIRMSGAVVLLGAVGVVGLQSAAFAASNPFPFLASGFTQTLYATNVPGIGGVAFAPNGGPMVVDEMIHQTDPTTTVLMDGSNVHPVTTITPTAPLYFGVVNGKNGALYANTHASVEEIDQSGNVLLGPIGPAGNGFGIAVDPTNGNLVYPDENGNISWVNESLTSVGVFASGASSEGLTFDPSGSFLFAAEFGAGINEYNSSGALVQNIPNTSSPDGMAFFAGTPNFLVSNNNDGSITRYDFPNGNFTQAPVQSVFASGGYRGDLSGVGPDGCLYVTQEGTNFGDGTTSTAGSLVQICPESIPPTGSTAPTEGPGYWKNHPAPTLLPQTLGGFSVSSWSTVKEILVSMKCSNSSTQNAIGCLVGQLLVAELNSTNGAFIPSCEATAISNANVYLSGLPYTGPSGTYSLTSAQRIHALALEDPLANSNAGSTVC